MPLSITYNNVPRTEDGGGGNIFKDTSFWIAHRVPERKKLVDLVQSNGGRVVPTEKNADMLIADGGNPKFAPPGSYSWRFIEDSVDNGYVQVRDRYRIGRDPDLPRPVAGGGMTKKMRAAFTPEQDASLAKWVLSHNVDRTGNKIYQEYEAKDPRHTWQSWRNRFMKTLRPLAPEKLERIAASAPAEVQHRSAPDPPSVQQPPTETKSVRPTPQQAERQPPAKHSKVAGDNRANAHRAAGQDQATVQRTPREEPRQKSAHRDTLQPADEAPGMSQFHQDFSEFMELQGQEPRLETRIGPKTIKLWDLLQAAEGQKVPPEEVDWTKVAEDLGYNWAQSRKVITQLRQYYEENLLPFLDAMDDFSSEADADKQGEEGEDISGPGGETVAVSSRSSRSPSNVPSSPPVNFTRGGKRPLDSQPDMPPTNGAKRRKLSSNREIPSTPEEALRFTSFKKGTEQQTQNWDSEASQQLPPLPSAKPKTTEPETQDYRIEGNTQQQLDPLARQESFDVTPSQQLHSEHTETTPIPFRLDPGRRDQNTSSDEPGESFPLSQQARAPKTTNISPSGSARSSPTAVSTPTRPKPAKVVKRSLPASFASKPARDAARSNVSRSSEPSRPRSEGIANESSGHGSSNTDEISYWIDHYESLGYSNSIVVQALKRTTMTPGGLAGIVMQSLKDGQGIPSHHEGIWTDRDDNHLRMIMSIDPDEHSQDARQVRLSKKARKEYTRLVQKHGSQRIELRKQFLEDEAADGDETVHG